MANLLIWFLHNEWGSIGCIFILIKSYDELLSFNSRYGHTEVPYALCGDTIPEGIYSLEQC